MGIKAADDYAFIRRRRDELITGGSDLEHASGSTLDKIGHAYHIYRHPGEEDHMYRVRIEAERTGMAI